MAKHLQLHSFTGTTDHDFTGLVAGETLQYDGTNIVSSGVGISGQTLSQVLTNGNTTANGQTIDAENGGGQLDLRYGGSDGNILLSTDDGAQGTTGFYATTAYTEMYGDGYNAGVFISNQEAGIYHQGSNPLAKVSLEVVGKEVIVANNTTIDRTSDNQDNVGVFIGSRNSTIESGVTNSVIAGGVGITASQDDSFYTQNARL
jgi:hypothetical protein